MSVNKYQPSKHHDSPDVRFRDGNSNRLTLSPKSTSRSTSQLWNNSPPTSGTKRQLTLNSLNENTNAVRPPDIAVPRLSLPTSVTGISTNYLLSDNARCTVCPLLMSPTSLPKSEDYPELKEDPITLDLERCDLCPSPGLVRSQEMTIHQRSSHRTELFTCAPCGRGYLTFQEVSDHVKTQHIVTGPGVISRILENILLPQIGLVGLVCGVCDKKYLGQVEEEVLEIHIQNTHGKIYLSVGGGKHVLRLCRVCDFRTTEERFMNQHIQEKHPKNIFAIDTDSEDENDNSMFNNNNNIKFKQESFKDRFKVECEKKQSEYDSKVEKIKLKKLLDSSLDRSTTSESEDNQDIVDLKTCTEIILFRLNSQKKKRKKKKGKPVKMETDVESKKYDVGSPVNNDLEVERSTDAIGRNEDNIVDHDNKMNIKPRLSAIHLDELLKLRKELKFALKRSKILLDKRRSKRNFNVIKKEFGFIEHQEQLKEIGETENKLNELKCLSPKETLGGQLIGLDYLETEQYSEKLNKLTEDKKSAIIEMFTPKSMGENLLLDSSNIYSETDECSKDWESHYDALRKSFKVTERKKIKRE